MRLVTVVAVALAAGTAPAADPPAKATGPLTVCKDNPRYFADAAGKPVYLVGSHTWANFMDVGRAGDPPFDYPAYLDFMAEHRFNFMRFWTWEHGAWATWTPEKIVFGPLPYARTGPGNALDGLPKFDLTKWDDAYFDRMRTRIKQAGDRGVYCSVMLFQAFSGIWPFSKAHQHDAFRGHYYNAANNVQNFDGDKDKNSILDIDDPEVRKLQAAWVRKVVDTVGDLDNVLYEVINEGGNEDWDRFVVQTVRDHEAKKGKHHPIGTTGHGGVKLKAALAGKSDWVSPGVMDDPTFKSVKTDPPEWDGKKVSVLDTDHVWGHGIKHPWVWKSFLRGHSVLFMDPWGPLAGWPDADKNRRDHPDYGPARTAMKGTAEVAATLDLARAVPRKELASSGFCLADPGRAYVAYLPEGKEITVDLSGAAGKFTVAWRHPTTGQVTPGEPVEGGGNRTLRSPLEADAVVVLRLLKP